MNKALRTPYIKPRQVQGLIQALDRAHRAALGDASPIADHLRTLSGDGERGLFVQVTERGDAVQFRQTSKKDWSTWSVDRPFFDAAGIK